MELCNFYSRLSIFVSSTPKEKADQALSRRNVMVVSAVMDGRDVPFYSYHYFTQPVR
jgi:hypothetical protein